VKTIEGRIYFAVQLDRRGPHLKSLEKPYQNSRLERKWDDLIKQILWKGSAYIDQLTREKPSFLGKRNTKKKDVYSVLKISAERNFSLVSVRSVHKLDRKEERVGGARGLRGEQKRSTN